MGNQTKSIVPLDALYTRGALLPESLAAAPRAVYYTYPPQLLPASLLLLLLRRGGQLELHLALRRIVNRGAHRDVVALQHNPAPACEKARRKKSERAAARGGQRLRAWRNKIAAARTA